MSALVLPGRPGRRAFMSQVALDAPPRTNCRLVVAMMQLAYAGLRFSDRRAFLDALRGATQVPEVDPATGGAQGTTAADLLRAMARLVPWVHVEAELARDTDLLAGLAAGRFTVGVSVPVYNGLPGRLARWSPRFDRGHMIWLASARSPDDEPEVLWVDPLGRGSYRGEWVRWSRVRPHLSQAGGRVFATVITKEAGLGTLATVVRAFARPATVTIPRGTPVYGVMADSLDVRQTGEAPRKLVATTTEVHRIRQRPARPPQGRFVLIASGDLEGRYVAADDVTLEEVPADEPVDVDAVRAAAFAEGRAAAEAEFQPLEEPVYRKAVPA